MVEFNIWCKFSATAVDEISFYLEDKKWLVRNGFIYSTKLNKLKHM
jgi:hypothetical protein